VNFILKKNQTEGQVFYNSSIPSQSGGGAWNAGLSKGFGDLDSDGWNILFTYSHDVQDPLEAAQRAVSSPGAYFPFSANGTNYIFNARTSNTEPANVTIGSLAASYNPYFQANGNCGQGALAAPLTVSGNTTCRFNYAATVEDIPGSKRDSGLLKATFDLHEGGKVWGEAVISQFDLTSQYAAAAQPFGISPTDPSTMGLWNSYVQPYLTATGQTATSATLGYRAVEAGGRTDDWQTKMRHIALPAAPMIRSWLPARVRFSQQFCTNRLNTSTPTSRLSQAAHNTGYSISTEVRRFCRWVRSTIATSIRSPTARSPCQAADT
jgi:iron complex outermembrane receptor protein